MRTMLGMCMALALAACAGGSGAPGGPNLATVKPIQPPPDAQPSSISFATLGAQQANVVVTGGTPPYVLKAADPRLVSFSPSTVAASGDGFIVAPVASGNTSMTITDALGNVTAVAVSTATCTPPSPSLLLSFPAPSATHVNASTTQIWTADSNSDPLLPDLSTFALRLVGSDGYAIQGGSLGTTTSSPPAGSASLPSGAYTYATSSVPGLASGIMYQVQLASAAHPCLPPMIIGSFST